jgi:hypothetical protein
VEIVGIVGVSLLAAGMGAAVWGWLEERRNSRVK